MPFTGSHPAAILPLLGLSVPASALVIGSLAPDLPYYIPMPVTAAETHSLAGVLGVDLVLGISAFLVWHLLLVPPLMWAAPAGMQLRIPGLLRGHLAPQLLTGRGWVQVCAALVLGAATHVAWDAVTHTGMWGPRVLPWLNTPILGLTLTRWLHLASSIVGLILLTWFLMRWWRQAPAVGAADPVRPLVRWVLAVILVGWAGLATAQLAISRVAAPGRVGRQTLLIDTLVEFISTLGLGLIIAAVGWHLVRAVRPDRVGATRPAGTDRTT